MDKIEILQKEIEQLELDAFSYLCNDQYDVYDKLNSKMQQKQNEIQLLLNHK